MMFICAQGILKNGCPRVKDNKVNLVRKQTIRIEIYTSVGRDLGHG